MKIKLQEYLKRHGYASSNKKARRLIRDSIVRVNGVQVKSCCIMVGCEKSSTVEVVMSSKDINASTATDIDYKLTSKALDKIEPFCIAYCKPCGMVCSKSTVENFCLNHIKPPVPDNFHPVGRLDQHSHGLLLFSSDGRLTSALMSPVTAIERVYRIIVKGDADVMMKSNVGSDNILSVNTDYGHFEGRIINVKTNVSSEYEHATCGINGGKRNDKFDNNEIDQEEMIKEQIPVHGEQETNELGDNLESESILSSITVAVKEGKKRMVRRLFAAVGLFVLGKFTYYEF